MIRHDYLYDAIGICIMMLWVFLNIAMLVVMIAAFISDENILVYLITVCAAANMIVSINIFFDSLVKKIKNYIRR